MVLARASKKNPRQLAERLTSRLPPSRQVQSVAIAGPGFINFFLTPEAFQAQVLEILAQSGHYGHSQLGARKRVQVEFVSANPTGPLHVGHGRGAAHGAAVAALLEAVGFEVYREYYVNDVGRQMDILATSVWLRYLELCGEELEFPHIGYQGDYIWDIAATLHRRHEEAYLPPNSGIELATHAAGSGGEAQMDSLIDYARDALGTDRYQHVLDLALDVLLTDIQNELSQFGVHFDRWYRERSLVESRAIERAIRRLADAGCVYVRDGAQWFRSTAFGDEKDRVLVRDNGQSTYFTSDIAYHLDKLARGFERVIDVWGADHHGYVARVKAALQALGEDPNKLHILLVQFANLYRGRERLQMSTRSGEFVTLRELRSEVGKDATRFFFVMRKHDQHLDFDLELAKSQSADNPVYYVQYAHARICSVMRQLHEKGYTWERSGTFDLSLLQAPKEAELIKTLSRYPEVVESAALGYEPHQLAFFLRELAHAFHTYYNAHTFLVEDKALRDARLALITATQQVIKNGLDLLGVSAPELM